MEWIDVVDSAVKIGLGALIAGLATYLTTRAGGEIEKDKLKLERKLLLIQEACQQVEAGFNDIEKFCGHLTGEVQKLINSGITDTKQLANKMQGRIQGFDDLLVNGRLKLVEGLSKITLAGLTIDYEDEKLGIYSIRDSLIFESKLPSIDTLHQVRIRLEHKHATTQQEIAAFYSSINK